MKNTKQLDELLHEALMEGCEDLVVPQLKEMELARQAIAKNAKITASEPTDLYWRMAYFLNRNFKLYQVAAVLILVGIAALLFQFKNEGKPEEGKQSMVVINNPSAVSYTLMACVASDKLNKKN
ncbi:MAG TPA: hypothetical protein PLU73_12295 [Bacteroidia bacterium]|nr:hypothetical protein [Bacteroidia bacterium]